MPDHEETPVTDTKPDPQPTNYHPSVEDFRRDLVKGHVGWEKTCQTYFEPVMGARRTGRTPTEAERDAYAGSLMAASYSYTLAAVLKLAEQEFGAEVAHTLACEAEELLNNGDAEPGWNADVWPLTDDAPKETS